MMGKNSDTWKWLIGIIIMIIIAVVTIFFTSLAEIPKVNCGPYNPEYIGSDNKIYVTCSETIGSKATVCASLSSTDLQISKLACRDINKDSTSFVFEIMDDELPNNFTIKLDINYSYRKYKVNMQENTKSFASGCYEYTFRGFANSYILTNNYTC